ncbi:uncharacterized protein J7T54_007646 [Emericellopsis cladophorae]|uniref:BZIP domain-containing protein n=1 Tax=Emericellopsis cladophorae TaxID=2686198 RepID=A0A9P9XVV4_9HYPO|nr:uncharacterized protein J7T54_007646 [Emericellopsis cladophorae]KAI6778705.1 hypothetical protein J7T54_007646 [Emericellopsis cladophorae]
MDTQRPVLADQTQQITSPATIMSASPSNRSTSRPASAASVDDGLYSPTSMQRSSSADHNKVSKRKGQYSSPPGLDRPQKKKKHIDIGHPKGTRSVSTLTPAQLARKRANDREAQRAIRARTKEHIERLEAELDELRSVHSRDQAVQELLRRNRMLEDELRSLRESVGLSSSHNSSSYHSAASYSMVGSLTSPRTSPYPSSDFSAPPPPPPPGNLPDYASAGYGPFAPAAAAGNAPSSAASAENWAAPGSTTSVPSNVSSPCSTNNDEYGTGSAYLPTSAPNPMVPSPASLRHHHGIKMEYEDGNDHGFPLEQHRTSSSSSMTLASNGFMPPQQHAAAWPPTSGMYYAAMQPPVY